MERVLSYLEANHDQALEGLKDFLRIPSVSTHPHHKADVLHCAEYLADELRRIGMKRVDVVPTAGHPIVYAEWLEAPGQPTVLMYGHYDVQPAEPFDLWESDPFDPTIRDGNLFARGSTDDKGQVWLHVKALEAHLEQHGRLPVNVKMLIEGEEEVASAHLDAYIERHKEDLTADVVMISDTTMYDYERPAIGYGLRGLVYMEIQIEGPNKDLHSGGYGGSVANPLNILSGIISEMIDSDGRIAIPGFYDDVVPLTDTEGAAFTALAFSEDEYAERLGVAELKGEKGYSTLERIWARPTLDVNGLLGGFTGEGSKTVIASKGMAKVSMRLVPNQDPEVIAQAFEAYVKKLAPSSVKINILRHGTGKPILTPRDHPAVKAVDQAITQGFGISPVYIREGGSIPVVATFQERLGLPTVLMGFGLPDCDAHAPNEKFNLKNFYRGIISAAWFYQEYSNDRQA
ncbi:MAG TPA: dipeptidase [candidate division Zixibacteria bacterium]|jgi:acetylornithine deacetylase/succinyl-diaminopimelate desuccinylase-like protein|nr:dipeptidase [candidate division Zixibacteria bacterium]